MSDNAASVPVQPGPAASPPARLRLWPGVLIVLAFWGIYLTPDYFEVPFGFMMFAKLMAPMATSILFAGWWIFASRSSHRLLILGVCLLLAGATYLARDPSMNLMIMVMFFVPALLTAWCAWLLSTPILTMNTRLAGLVCVMLIVWGTFASLRFDGVNGSFSPELAWRWSRTAEDIYLAELKAKPKPTPVEGKEVGHTETSDDWPCFRGIHRDGVRPGVRVGTDWDKNPPKKVWRHRIGPGWSSFAAVGSRLYTQEQRGDDEVVVCYDADTGEELWNHADAERFTEAVAGPGPRATPTFHDGKIYAMGAKGILNCLDASTGAVVWKADIVKTIGHQGTKEAGPQGPVPIWGFAGSPLIVNGIVVVFAGDKDKAVLGYDIATGNHLWSGGKGTHSYCSPQLAKVDNTDQVVICTDAGMTALDPRTGQELWHHEWQTENNLARIVQPAQLGDSEFILGTGLGVGTQRVRVKRDGDAWKTDTVWNTKAIKPYFNDFVIHKGHLYGFDDKFFTCVRLEDGKRIWRERGYGNGQVLLLPDQELLLVLSEEGDIVLVKADPDKRQEIGRVDKAISGKTWNHPVIVRDKLFIRNGEEVACYQLPGEKK